jgi:signal transduction histidine kinase
MALPARKDLMIDAAIAVAVFAASVVLLAVGGGGDLVTEEGGVDTSGSVDAVGLLLAALASLPLAARRVSPIGVFLVTGLAAVALTLVSNPAGPPLGPTLAIYWMAAAGDESRARTRLVLSLVASMLVLHVAASGLAEDRFPAVEIVFGVLVWGGALLAGDRTRLRHERMAELEQRALEAEREAERERRLAAAEERTRIARDLHDSAGHAINVILVHAGLGRLRAEKDPPAARAAFETIEEVARETIGEIDQLVRVLRDADPSAEVEPPPGVAALDGLVGRHRAAGMDVTATVSGEPRPLPPAVDQAAYRILQEALTNAARHGGGSAEVEVAFGGSALELTVVNPVRDGAATGRGYGISGMRERAALLGGRLEAGIRDGHYRVRAQVPMAGA